MIWISTRGRAPAVPFRDALLAGLAPDGGLYVPAEVPQLPAAAIAALGRRPVADVGATLLAPFLEGALPADDLSVLLADALDFPLPLVRLDEHLLVLELFHGPTCAFKDVGARVLARLLARLHAGEAALTVLVATSGDTGGAVAHAFHGVPRTRVVVLYPEGQVSAVQEAQFTTLGGNVTAVAVDGTFDDCQRLVKQAFADQRLRGRVPLTSANSISLGRLLPQMIYYGLAAGRLAGGPPPVISVPSGNFGNLAAGLLARTMGVPVAAFVAATTVNDTVPRYLASGVVEPRASVPTLASAMDVGDPSNLERIRWLFGDDVPAMRAVMTARAFSDDDVRRAIGELDRRYGYVADPHTAIAYLGATGGAAPAPPGVPRVFLATAHPAKFGTVVEAVIGRRVPWPPPLADAVAKPRQIVRLPASSGALTDFLDRAAG